MSASSDLEVTSDAAGSLGFRAYFRGKWFSSAWGHASPVHCLQGTISHCHSCSHLGPAHAVVQTTYLVSLGQRSRLVIKILISRTSKTPSFMFLLHDLLFVRAHFSFTFTALHVPGIHNKVADVPSHFHWQEFRLLALEAQSCPVVILYNLLEDLTSPLLSDRE